MNKSTSYSLSITIIFFLMALAGTLLIAPQLLLAIFPELSGWQTGLTGGLLYVLTLIYFGLIVLDHPPTQKRIVEFLCALFLAALAYSLWQAGYYAEFFWLAALTLTILFHSWLKIILFDWLQAAQLSANLVIGLYLLTDPGLAAINMPALNYAPMRLAMATGFLSSALIAVLTGFYADKNKKEQWHLLSIPWLLWALLALLNRDMLQLIVAGSASLGLLTSEIVPWDKVILREGKNIGRRFFYFISAGQSLTLIIILAMLTATRDESERVFEVLHQIALFNFLLAVLIGMVLVILLNLSINGLFSGLSGKNPLSNDSPPGGSIFAFLRSVLSEPFQESQKLSFKGIQQQKEYERLLAQMIAGEKRRMAQLSLLQQLNLELDSFLDPPVSAQLTANAVQSSLGGSLCAVLEYDSERNEMGLLAASGPAAHKIPPGYRQNTQTGIIGRAARLRRSQLVSDTRLDPDYLAFENQLTLSELVIPILFYNQLKGCIVLGHSAAQAFDDSDIRTLETIALRLVSSWQRSDHDQRLTRLIQAGVSLSTTLEVEAVISQITEIAQKTLDARFVFVALVDKGGGFTRVAQAGYAPTLSSILNSDPEGNVLVQTVLNQVGPIRVRDVRKRFSSIPTGSSDLRTLLALPIRLRQANIGVMLAFGKIGAKAFSENDEGLSNLLAGQAAAAVETTWLYQELRSMLTTATQLYQLSTRVIQAEQLTDAAAAIAETTYQLIRAQAAGITLVNAQGEIEAQVQIDSSGLQPGTRHPLNLIKQTLRSGQSIMVSGENEMARVCVPLQTPRKQYGALWIKVPEKNWANARFSDNLQTLANQAAIALERSILLTETRQQAEQIEAAYRKLEVTYDQTLAALSSALDARDRETEGHSIRVARLTSMLGQHLGIDPTQLKMLERGAILHDIGKIGVSDTILLKPGPLTEPEWELMRMHPDIGAEIIEGIPFLEETLPIIRYHQERWNGSGYPLGLSGKEIPLAARIFAVVDAYDALTTDRPYRKKTTTKEALDHLHEQAGKLFDPDIVVAFEQLIKNRGEKL
ncbi:MAG: GAF domain-containing protein [Anaerolineales bacterium]|jgi:putative nucleotidyltransferase with HDIG domain|nr:GAF domain-containing protein [Anaerolineales bacterium]